MTPDEDLARAAQQGDRAALNTLIRRHHGPLLGFLYRMTGGDRTLGEDLVQESFLRVTQSIGQYQYPRRFKPWLYAIATNLARDHYKRADTRRVDSFEPMDLHPAADPSPEFSLIAADSGREVITALASLSDSQRETIILRYYQDLSLEEIAEVLTIPVGTVKSRLSIGLRRLKVIMEAFDSAAARSERK